MKNISRKIFFLLLPIGLFLTLIFSLSCGQIDIPLSSVLATLAKGAGLSFFRDAVIPPGDEAVIIYIRLPRTIVGWLVGASLAASGAVMQGIFGNPLADPGTIGVSSGACVGAVVAIAFGLNELSLFSLPLCALVGALLAVALTISLAMRHGKIPVMTLLLAGVVVGMFLGAVTSGLLTVMDEQRISQYLFWTIGGLDYRRWEHVWLGAAPIAVCLLVMLALARHLNVLALGDTEAKAVGMPVLRFRLGLLLVASLCTATSVCISGNIGFVGLVVPHAMRLVVGADHRRLLPASLLFGSIFLVLCDTLGRLIAPPLEVRAGIMTAIFGTPYFLYLLRKARNLNTA